MLLCITILEQSNIKLRDNHGYRDAEICNTR